jgi:hypothetical protein
VIYGRRVTRAKAVALLALGCALAAAAASTGPFLVATPRSQSFFTSVRTLLRVRRARQYTPNAPPRGAGRVVNDLDTAFQVVVFAVLAAALLYGLYHVLRALGRLVRLLLERSRGGAATAAYDPGEESRDDSETALRRRVAEELTTLSADLDADTDPREVVIACYLRMEGALARAGSPRGAAETPLELLSRVLGEQAVPDADVRRLTALFTEARFSTHPVTDEMRAAARRSVSAVAGALTVDA